MPVIVLAPSRLLSISDGDTADVRFGMRMLGIDTPEMHFPEGRLSSTQDAVLEGLPNLDGWKKLPKGLRDYLAPRLEGAGTRQYEWGLAAKAALEKIMKEGLASPGPGRPRRSLFLACGKEVFDRYGRPLVYMGPHVPRAERTEDRPPDTFNLQMLAAGHAVLNLHKANLPKKEDLDLAIAAMQSARKKKLGFWAERDRILHGYEFRSLVRLARGEPGFTYRVHDLRALLKGDKTTRDPTEYYKIAEEYRVFE